jgi:hypothetical protein
MLGRHQHPRAAAVPRDRDRLALRLMLEFVKPALKLLGGRPSHSGHPRSN